MIDISEGIGASKANGDICHDWYFLDEACKYEPYLCNACHNLMQKAVEF